VICGINTTQILTNSSHYRWSTATYTVKLIITTASTMYTILQFIANMPTAYISWPWENSMKFTIVFLVISHRKMHKNIHWWNRVVWDSTSS